MSRAEAELRRRAEAHGQAHLLGFLRGREGASRAALLEEIGSLDFPLLERLAALARSATAGGEIEAELEPAEVFPLRRSDEQEALAERARRRGSELLGAGRLACLLVAGGQGSRLGREGPKGTFPVGPVSGRSLFELHARRLLAAQRRHGAPIPLYVMTSAENDAATRAFFARHEDFGLERGSVRFFTQGSLPALDARGRVLRASKAALVRAPDGHGGALAALARSGCLEDARRRGVTVLSYVQVDNPLARAADPLYVGLHSLARARMSSKVLRKRDAAEGLGVIGRSRGKYRCIEYSDLPPALREARDERGELLWGMGGIAVHLIDCELVEELQREGVELPWHVARKRIRCLGEDDREAVVDGFKFERLVFDALAWSERSVTLEVDRELEFCPLKNASGEDSPRSVREGLCRLHARWARAAGLDVPPPDETGVVPVEIDPLLAESERELRGCGRLAPEVRENGFLYR